MQSKLSIIAQVTHILIAIPINSISTLPNLILGLLDLTLHQSLLIPVGYAWYGWFKS